MDERVKYISEFPKAEIEKRKQLIRDVWNYRKVDHIPIMMSLDYNPWGYTMHDELYNHDIQFTMRMYACEQSLKLLPDDYIPSAFVNVGCVGVSSAFGSEIYKGDSKWQTPGIKGTVLDSIEDVEKLDVPDMRSLGFSKYYLERLKYFWERTEGCVYLSGMDTNGPMGVAMDLLGSSNLFYAMIDDPEKVRTLLRTISKAILQEIEASIEITGDVNVFTSTDFFYCWCPEGKKGHSSSDLCAGYSPELFSAFDIFANNMIYEKYGGGLLHNCGPNPCLQAYLNHTPDISGVNLAYNYSKDDLSEIKKVLRGKIVYFFFEEELLGAIEHYRKVMEELAPDVIAIPILSVTDANIDAIEIYNQFRQISTEYAHRVFG